jgi:hypothetical protein
VLLTVIVLVYTVNVKYCFILFVPCCVCVWAMQCCVIKLVTHCHRPVKNRDLKLDCGPSLNYMHVIKTFRTFG